MRGPLIFVLCGIAAELLQIPTYVRGEAHQSPRRPPAFHDFILQSQRRTAIAARATGEAAAVVYPIAFGADPTGQNDSTAALQSAIHAASAHIVPGHFIGNKSSVGGATVDLQGGEYRVSEALFLGRNIGGLRICCGTLYADSNFPVMQAILNLGNLEDITIEDIAFECNRRGGAIATSNTLRVHVSRVYILHYATVGIHIVGGHEVHVGDSYIGEFLWGEQGSGTGKASRNLTGTAIKVDGQDHWISDIVVFSGKYGIVLNGGALVLTNSHIYNGGEEALLVQKGSHAVRVLGCYFDFNRVTLIDPVAVDISHSLFLGGTGIQICSSQPNAMIAGLHAVHNQFVVGAADRPGPWEAVYLNTTAGTFGSVNGTIIDSNTNPPATYGPFRGQTQHLRSTVVRRTLTQSNASTWRFDLTDAFVFPISVARLHVSFSVEAEEGFPIAVLRPVQHLSDTSALVLVVHSNAPFSGAVHIIAHQGGLI